MGDYSDLLLPPMDGMENISIFFFLRRKFHDPNRNMWLKNKQKSVQHLLVSAARAHVPIHLEIGVKLSVVALIFS